MRGRLGHAVVFRQRAVHERVGPVQQVEDGAIALRHIDKVANGLLEHRLAQFVGEGGEALAIDTVVLLEAAEVEPVAGELGRQAAHPGIAQHAPRLGLQHLRSVQVSRCRVRQQFVVGHARPQEIAQPTGQLIIGQRPGGRTGLRQVEAVIEMGR